MYGEQVLKCALKVPREAVQTETIKYPMERGSRMELHALLPEHVRTCGPIVGVSTELFEVTVI